MRYVLSKTVIAAWAQQDSEGVEECDEAGGNDYYTHQFEGGNDYYTHQCVTHIIKRHETNKSHHSCPDLVRQ